MDLNIFSKNQSSDTMTGFDELFFVDLPTEEERKDILSIYMRKYLQLDFDGEFADKIVEMTAGFTGADLESAVRELAYNNLADGTEITGQAIIDVFENVVPLSQTSPEKISAIREWGKSRAVPASGRPIGDGVDLSDNNNIQRTRKVLV